MFTIYSYLFFTLLNFKLGCRINNRSYIGTLNARFQEYVKPSIDIIYRNNQNSDSELYFILKSCKCLQKLTI